MAQVPSQHAQLDLSERPPFGGAWEQHSLTALVATPGRKATCHNGRPVFTPIGVGKPWHQMMAGKGGLMVK